MKKFLLLILCGVLLMSTLFGCSQASNEQSPTADNAVGDDTEDNTITATSKSLEKFYNLLWDDYIYNFTHTTYEYTLTITHCESADITLSGISADAEATVNLNNFVHTIKPDFSNPWEYMNGLLGGGEIILITITASDGSVLTIDNKGCNHRYILTHPDGTEEKALCTCDASYLAEFLAVILCNEKNWADLS